MSSPPHVVVVGASGALGEQVLAALHGGALAGGGLRLFGSSRRSSRVDAVPFGPDSLPVEPVGQLGEAEADLAFVCAPPEVAARVAAGLVARGAFVVVPGGGEGTGLPLVQPGELEGSLGDVRIARGLRTPSAAGQLVAALAGPLRAAGLDAVRGTVLWSASHHGRAAVEELGQQVVASLTNQDPQRRVFPQGLAFDVLPEDAPDDWSAAERRLAADVSALTGLGEAAVALSAGTIPAFAGLVASLQLGGVGVDAALAAWRDQPLLREISQVERLRPRVLTGKAVAGWGRLRADPAGDAVHVWACADNLSFSAWGAVRLAEAAWGHGLVGGRAG